jgi:hypothetical protein
MNNKLTKISGAKKLQAPHTHPDELFCFELKKKERKVASLKAPPPFPLTRIT